jgi:hypothetical protein
VKAFGFVLKRIEGSHHFFRHPQTQAVLNLQPQGGQAKDYQIRQFLKLVDQYNLKLEKDEDADGDNE